jgi:hypothetical protein
MLAKLHRAGELTPIWIPDAAHEVMRDLVRARATAVNGPRISPLWGAQFSPLGGDGDQPFA